MNYGIPLLIGYAAGFLTTIAFLPQLIKVIKTRSTRDISLGMFLIFSTGVFLWLIYGILIESAPVIVANLITFVMAFAIFIYKIRYK